MRKSLPLIFVTALVSGCGGQVDLSCDKPALYQQARESDRVVAPDGFDQLDLSREMPVPSAAPGATSSRQPGDPCLDIPPRYLEQVRQQEEERARKRAEKEAK